LKEKISVSVSLKSYKADTIRYAAYAVSGGAYVLLGPGKKGEVEAAFEPKPNASAKYRAGLQKLFESELRDEKMRSEIADANRELREFMVLKALSAADDAGTQAGDYAGLTPAQEKELDALIAEVEREIKTETAGKERKDPLGITKTWEEKHGSEPFKNKNKK